MEGKENRHSLCCLFFPTSYLAWGREKPEDHSSLLHPSPGRRVMILPMLFSQRHLEAFSLPSHQSDPRQFPETVFDSSGTGKAGPTCPFDLVSGGGRGNRQLPLWKRHGGGGPVGQFLWLGPHSLAAGSLGQTPAHPTDSK